MYEYIAEDVYGGAPNTVNMDKINEFAKKGWRVHTVLNAPGIGIMTKKLYCLFEREIAVEKVDVITHPVYTGEMPKTETSVFPLHRGRPKKVS